MLARFLTKTSVRTSQDPRFTPIIWTAPDLTSASRLAITSGSRRSVGVPGGSVPGEEGRGVGGGGGGGGGLRLAGGGRGGGLRLTGGGGRGGGLRLTSGGGWGGLGLGDGGGGGLRLGGGGGLGLGGGGGGEASDAGSASSMPCGQQSLTGSRPHTAACLLLSAVLCS